ncbi:MAG: LysR substrate-binding domain-containing protein [Halopseudomonas sp.]
MQPKLPLNNLNTFASAAEFCSFQIAAEHLHVTPSAVSHQIRNLEQLLGYKLFERLDKRVRLTVRGERLFETIRLPFQDIHQAIDQALKSFDGNSLSLSVAPAFATRWLLPRLDRFYAKHPEINLSLTATTDLVNFRRDSIDAAIRLGSGDWPGAESLKLFDTELVAVCRPSLIEQNQGLFTLEQLSRQALVHNATMGQVWESWFRSAGMALSGPLPGLSVQNSAQGLEAVQSGERICLIDRPLVKDELASGKLATASLHSYSGGLAYYLVCANESSTYPPLQTFKQWLLAIVKSS